MARRRPPARVVFGRRRVGPGWRCGDARVRGRAPHSGPLPTRRGQGRMARATSCLRVWAPRAGPSWGWRTSRVRVAAWRVCVPPRAGARSFCVRAEVRRARSPSSPPAFRAGARSPCGRGVLRREARLLCARAPVRRGRHSPCVRGAPRKEERLLCVLAPVRRGRRSPSWWALWRAARPERWTWCVRAPPAPEGLVSPSVWVASARLRPHPSTPHLFHVRSRSRPFSPCVRRTFYHRVLLAGHRPTGGKRGFAQKSRDRVRSVSRAFETTVIPPSLTKCRKASRARSCPTMSPSATRLFLSMMARLTRAPLPM